MKWLRRIAWTVVAVGAWLGWTLDPAPRECIKYLLTHGLITDTCQDKVLDCWDEETLGVQAYLWVCDLLDD